MCVFTIVVINNCHPHMDKSILIFHFLFYLDLCRASQLRRPAQASGWMNSESRQRLGDPKVTSSNAFKKWWERRSCQIHCSAIDGRIPSVFFRNGWLEHSWNLSRLMEPACLERGAIGPHAQ